MFSQNRFYPVWEGTRVEYGKRDKIEENIVRGCPKKKDQKRTPKMADKWSI